VPGSYKKLSPKGSKRVVEYLK